MRTDWNITHVKRRFKFILNTLKEKLRGLDFSMIYVGEFQKENPEYYEYKITDADDMKKILKLLPVNPAESAFLDVGCGKGLCLKCAVEAGFKKVSGIDLDEDMLAIARRNFQKLKMDVECMHAEATTFEGYSEYDVIYFFNPFGEVIFKPFIQKIIDSQAERNRDIWIAYYHPACGELFEKAGFVLTNEIPDKMRGTSTKYFCYPKREDKV